MILKTDFDLSTLNLCKDLLREICFFINLKKELRYDIMVDFNDLFRYFNFKIKFVLCLLLVYSPVLYFLISALSVC